MAEQPQQQFSVQRIYLKDVSFETPMGADVFKNKWEELISNHSHDKTSIIFNKYIVFFNSTIWHNRI